MVEGLFPHVNTASAIYNLTTLCLKGTLPYVDYMEVTMGDIPLEVCPFAPPPSCPNSSGSSWCENMTVVLYEVYAPDFAPWVGMIPVARIFIPFSLPFHCTLRPRGPNPHRIFTAAKRKANPASVN